MRIIDILLWPILELLMFGLLATSLQTQKNSALSGLSLLVIGLIFWYVFARMTAEIILQIGDDTLSRNLKNILASPINLWQLQIALVLAGFTKVFLNLFVLIVVGTFFFHLPIFPFGVMTFAYVFLLLSWGLSLGLFLAGLLFIFGDRVIMLSWAIAGILQPFSLVFYPRSALPPVMKIVTYFIPASYVFESMRLQLSKGAVDAFGLTIATACIVLTFFLSTIFFHLSHQHARKTGLIMRL